MNSGRKKPIVLMISTNPKSLGGISSVIALYKKFLRADEFRFKYLYSHRDGSPLLKRLYFLRALILFFGYLPNPSCQIIHIHTASYKSFRRKSIFLFWARLFSKKIILHIHGGGFMSFYDRAHASFKRKLLKTFRRADVVISLSAEWKESLTELVDPSKILVFHNTVEIPPEIERRPKKIVDILFLGSLNEKKGIFDLIEAAARIERRNFQILLGGEGANNKVREFVNRRGLSENVRLLGWISGGEKIECLRRSDFFVLPSYQEGLPMSVLEAMAYSLPVIATPVGGIPTLVKDGTNGYLIEPGGVQDLSSKIEELSGDYEKRLRFGKAGYEIVKKNFNIEKTVHDLLELYASLLIAGRYRA